MADENTNPNVPLDSTSAHNAQKRKSTHHLHVDLHLHYQPLQKRSQRTHLSSQDAEQRRIRGEHHLDLWTDGRLYPRNPSTNATPPFSNVTSLLHFTGDGKQGLLGYIQQIESKASGLEMLIEVMSKKNNDLFAENQLLIQRLKSHEETIKELEKTVDRMRQKDTQLGLRRRKRKLTNIQQIKLGSGGAKKRIHAIRFHHLSI